MPRRTENSRSTRSTQTVLADSKKVTHVATFVNMD